jgi:hypothetical protein
VFPLYGILLVFILTTRGKFDINESVSPIIMEGFSWPDAASKHSSISGKTYLNATVSMNGRQDNQEICRWRYDTIYANRFQFSATYTINSSTVSIGICSW